MQSPNKWINPDAGGEHSPFARAFIAALRANTAIIDGGDQAVQPDPASRVEYRIGGHQYRGTPYALKFLSSHHPRKSLKYSRKRKTLDSVAGTFGDVRTSSEPVPID